MIHHVLLNSTPERGELEGTVESPSSQSLPYSDPAFHISKPVWIISKSTLTTSPTDLKLIRMMNDVDVEMVDAQMMYL
jgi:hypothetical protein